MYKRNKNKKLAKAQYGMPSQDPRYATKEGSEWIQDHNIERMMAPFGMGMAAPYAGMSTTPNYTREPKTTWGKDINWNHAYGSELLQGMGSMLSNGSANSYQNSTLRFNQQQFSPMNYLAYSPNNSNQALYGMQDGGEFEEEADMRNYIFDEGDYAPQQPRVNPQQQAVQQAQGPSDEEMYAAMDFRRRPKQKHSLDIGADGDTGIDPKVLAAVAELKGKFPGLQVTSGLRSWGDKDGHPAGRAMDLAGPGLEQAYKYYSENIVPKYGFEKALPLNHGTGPHIHAGHYQGGGNVSAYNPNLAGKDKAFQAWYSKNTVEGKNGIPFGQNLDYDYYSYFRNGDYKNYQGGHFPDTYKMPNHATFSDESIYSVPGNIGGHWNGEHFIPHKQEGGLINSTGYLDGAPTANNPYNIIPGGNITMEGVSQPIVATAFKKGKKGKTVLMQPGQNYQFDADFVHETPAMQKGGKVLKVTPQQKEDIKLARELQVQVDTWNTQPEGPAKKQMLEQYNQMLQGIKQRLFDQTKDSTYLKAPRLQAGGSITHDPNDYKRWQDSIGNHNMGIEWLRQEKDRTRKNINDFSLTNPSSLVAGLSNLFAGDDEGNHRLKPKYGEIVKPYSKGSTLFNLGNQKPSKMFYVGDLAYDTMRGIPGVVKPIEREDRFLNKNELYIGKYASMVPYYDAPVRKNLQYVPATGSKPMPKANIPKTGAKPQPKETTSNLPRNRQGIELENHSNIDLPEVHPLEVNQRQPSYRNVKEAAFDRVAAYDNTGDASSVNDSNLGRKMRDIVNLTYDDGSNETIDRSEYDKRYPKMQKGGHTPIYTSNPNDPRLKAYNDSVSLYSKYLTLLDDDVKQMHAKNKADFNFHQPTSDELNFSNNYRTGQFIKPTAMYDRTPSDPHTSWIARAVYKKPVQPIQYVNPKDAVIGRDTQGKDNGKRYTKRFETVPSTPTSQSRLPKSRQVLIDDGPDRTPIHLPGANPITPTQSYRPVKGASFDRIPDYGPNNDEAASVNAGELGKRMRDVVTVTYEDGSDELLDRAEYDKRYPKKFQKGGTKKLLSRQSLNEADAMVKEDEARKAAQFQLLKQQIAAARPGDVQQGTEQGQITRAGESQSALSKAWEVARNPFSAASYAVRGQRIPDNFSTDANRRASGLDNIGATINPTTWAQGLYNTGKRIAEPIKTAKTIGKAVIDLSTLSSPMLANTPMPYHGQSIPESLEIAGDIGGALQTLGAAKALAPAAKTAIRGTKMVDELGMFTRKGGKDVYNLGAVDDVSKHVIDGSELSADDYRKMIDAQLEAAKDNFLMKENSKLTAGPFYGEGDRRAEASLLGVANYGRRKLLTDNHFFTPEETEGLESYLITGKMPFKGKAGDAFLHKVNSVYGEDVFANPKFTGKGARATINKSSMPVSSDGKGISPYGDYIPSLYSPYVNQSMLTAAPNRVYPVWDKWKEQAAGAIDHLELQPYGAKQAYAEGLTPNRLGGTHKNSYNKGGEYELTEKEIQDLIAQGYQIEF